MTARRRNPVAASGVSTGGMGKLAIVTITPQKSGERRRRKWGRKGRNTEDETIPLAPPANKGYFNLIVSINQY